MIFEGDFLTIAKRGVSHTTETQRSQRKKKKRTADILFRIVISGLRQKTLLKYPQTCIPKRFYLVLIGLLLYLGYRRFWVFNVFPLSRKDLRLISSSKVFKSRYYLSLSTSIISVYSKPFKLCLIKAYFSPPNSIKSCSQFGLEE